MIFTIQILGTNALARWRHGELLDTASSGACELRQGSDSRAVVDYDGALIKRCRSGDLRCLVRVVAVAGSFASSLR